MAACETPRPIAPEPDTLSAAVRPLSDPPILDRMAAEVRRRWPWVIDDRRELWVYFIADARDSILIAGVRWLDEATARSVVGVMVREGSNGRSGIRAIVTGFDALDVERIVEFGKGVRTAAGELVAGQHVVIWVRVRSAQGLGEPGRAQGPFRTDTVLSESAVELRPSLRSGPMHRYPELLRLAGIEGRVVLQAIVGEAGVVEPGSITVLDSSHPGFNESAQAHLLASRFTPGRLNGRPVRVRITYPVRFTRR